MLTMARVEVGYYSETHGKWVPAYAVPKPSGLTEVSFPGETNPDDIRLLSTAEVRFFLRQAHDRPNGLQTRSLLRRREL